MPVIDADRLRTFSRDLFVAAGAGAGEAQRVAESLVEANLAASGSLSAREARVLQKQLREAPRLCPVADAFDRHQRFLFLDSATFLARSRGGGSISPHNDLSAIDSLTYAAVDWNVALSSGNAFYDEIVAAAKESNFLKIEILLDDIEATMEKHYSASDSWRAGVAAEIERARSVVLPL